MNESAVVVVGAVDNFGPAAESLLAMLWRASWQAALIALVLLALQWVLRDRLAARWRHALWLLVFARLALPVLPPSPTSAFNLVDATPLAGPARQSRAAETNATTSKATTTTTTATTVVPSSPSPSSTNQPTPSVPRPIQPQPQTRGGGDDGATERPKLADPIQGPAAPRASGTVDRTSTDRAAADVAGSGAQPPATPSARPRLREQSQARELAISLIWLAGAAALLLRNIVASLRLSAMRRRFVPVTSPALRELLDGARAELRVRRRIELLTSDSMPAPALIGLWRPAIVLPRHVLARMSRPELRLVVLHELAHVKRHDLLINWLTAVLAAVHWFNPMVWVVVARMRSDRELACDELVLARAGHANGAGDPRAAYGGVLVKLIEAIAATSARPASSLRRPPRAGTAILENAHQLERRVKCIATFAPRPRAWSLIALAAALVLCLTLMTAPVTAQYERAMQEFLTPLARPAEIEAADAPGKRLEIVVTATQPATQPGAEAVADARAGESFDGWMLEQPENRDVVVAEPVWEPGAVVVPNPTVASSVERLARSVARRRKQAEAEAQVIMEQIAKFRGEHPNILHEEAVSKEVATVSQALLEARLQLIDARATYGEHHDRTKAAQSKHDELARLSEQTIKRSAEINTTMAEYQKLTTALTQKQELIRRLDDRAASLEEMGQIIDGMSSEARGPTTNPLGQEASPLPPRLIVVDEKIAARNDATARVLEQPVSELRFDRTPMAQVIERFGQLAPGTNVYVDWNGLMTCGVDRNFPVSLHLRDVPLGVAIAQTLRAAQDQTGLTARTRLTYVIDHGNVSITTEEEADKILYTVTYDVSDLARDARALERVSGLVRQSVRPNVWRDAGGNGEIGGFGGKLVVTVNDTTHREIAKLLASLRPAPTTAPAQ